MARHKDVWEGNIVPRPVANTDRLIFYVTVDRGDVDRKEHGRIVRLVYNPKKAVDILEATRVRDAINAWLDEHFHEQD